MTEEESNYLATFTFTWAELCTLVELTAHTSGGSGWLAKVKPLWEKFNTEHSLGKMNKSPLLSMKDGETLYLNTKESWSVLKVPGGWIYTIFTQDVDGSINTSSVCVPEPK